LNIPELDIEGEIWNCSLLLIAIEPEIVLHLFMAQGGGYYYYDDPYYYGYY